MGSSPIRTAVNRFRSISEAVDFFYRYQSGTKNSTFLVTFVYQATPLSAQNPRITVSEKGYLFNNLVLEPQLVPPNPTIGTKEEPGPIRGPGYSGTLNMELKAAIFKHKVTIIFK